MNQPRTFDWPMPAVFLTVIGFLAFILLGLIIVSGFKEAAFWMMLVPLPFGFVGLAWLMVWRMRTYRSFLKEEREMAARMQKPEWQRL